MSAPTVRDLLTAASRELAERSGSSLAAASAVALQLTAAELAELTRVDRQEPRRPIGDLLRDAAATHPQREVFSQPRLLDLLKDLTPAELEQHAASPEASTPAELEQAASPEASTPAELEQHPASPEAS